MSTSSQDNAFGRAMLEAIVDWIAENMDPADVFTDKKLADWAESNGYEKEDT